MAGEARKILIVEDSPTMRKFYGVVLGGEPSLAVSFAGDGMEGLDRAAQEADIALFIVDINMPRMDGVSFIRRLRGELGLERQPVVVVSTESADADRRTALDAGATAYLQKPLEPEALLSTVRRLTEDADDG